MAIVDGGCGEDSSVATWWQFPWRLGLRTHKEGDGACDATEEKASRFWVLWFDLLQVVVDDGRTWRCDAMTMEVVLLAARLVAIAETCTVEMVRTVRQGGKGACEKEHVGRQ
ncbi:hypothetical protein LR48_Vigan09g052300 [Vigna angularis]|uniref:Uncharacterized protein n=1 Tax=Phaseolus angularis TaxID=3914 RepID=A0A0L9VB34_PHAAN|nr:hypothetical protein LR48_Vigan09g052300 [Vigna angularis]